MAEEKKKTKKTTRKAGYVDEPTPTDSLERPISPKQFSSHSIPIVGITGAVLGIVGLFFTYYSINTVSLDLQALVRAVAVSLGVGLMTGATSFFVTKKRAEWERWRGVIVMGITGIAILVGIGTYSAWPSLVNIPSLDGLSQAQAEDLLRQNRLVPQARPQYSDNTDAGRVIAHSQSHPTGLSVRAGTVVFFAVSEGQATPSPTHPTPPTMNVSFFKPKSGETISLTRGPDGIYRLSVQGTSSGLPNDRYGLLLWLKPLNPPADRIGWYLQKPPNNGITSVDADGTWIGIAQVGNAQYLPHEGNTIDLAITITDKSDIDKLMAEQGVVVRNEPVGVRTAKASEVVVTLK